MESGVLHIDFLGPMNELTHIHTSRLTYEGGTVWFRSLVSKSTDKTVVWKGSEVATAAAVWTGSPVPDSF